MAAADNNRCHREQKEFSAMIIGLDIQATSKLTWFAFGLLCGRSATLST